MITIITILSGGTGTPKLLQGIKEVIDPGEIRIIVNTGEDLKQSGVLISPDIDTVTYTMANIIDQEKWYGIEDDTYHFHNTMKNLGKEELLTIGDKDRALKTFRTLKMKEGDTLSEITDEIRKKLGIDSKILPMTNDIVNTEIITENGEKLEFHKYWVERRAKDPVREVNYLNSEKASPAPQVLESINESEKIIIGPSNPVTSIGPMIAIGEIRKGLEKNREKTIAVSPIIGEEPVSGPTGKLMEGLGYEVTPVGVGRLFENFVNKFVIHENDESFRSELESMGFEVQSENILLNDLESKIELAKKLL